MPLRRFVDGVIIVMLAGLLGGAVWYFRNQQHSEDQHQKVRRALSSLYDKIQFHRALAQADKSSAGYPAEILPQWFADEKRPANILLPGQRPWIDTADAKNKSDHPPDPVAVSPQQAEFWYNPNLGIIRARVPHDVSHQVTLDLYNRVNASRLMSLPAVKTKIAAPRQPATREPQPAVTPVAAPIVQTPAPIPVARQRPTLLDTVKKRRDRSATAGE